MKIRLLALLFLLLLPGTALAGGQALMLTVFGTSTEASVTFDELLPMVEKRFPNRHVVVPYTSSVIRNKLNAKISDPAEKILSPSEMLEKLKTEGYTDIAVLSTLLFPGVEHEKLEASVEAFSAANKGIRVSYLEPLLGERANLQPVIESIGKHLIPDGSNIVVAHGTHSGHASEKIYLELAELTARNYPNARVGSVEGLPDIAAALDWAGNRPDKEVRFVVFMFVAGDHAENDIASKDEDSFFSAMRAKGKNPSVAYVQSTGGPRIASLGLDPEYRELLLDYYSHNVK